MSGKLAYKQAGAAKEQISSGSLSAEKEFIRNENLAEMVSGRKQG